MCRSPQVGACWSGVSSVLVDDFVGCGTDQILLVFQDQKPPDSVTNFMMTDLCGTMYSVSLACSRLLSGIGVDLLNCNVSPFCL